MPTTTATADTTTATGDAVPSNTWAVANRDHVELARVVGVTREDAMAAAKTHPHTMHLVYLRFRRLTLGDLRIPEMLPGYAVANLAAPDVAELAATVPARCCDNASEPIEFRCYRADMITDIQSELTEMRITDAQRRRLIERAESRRADNLKAWLIWAAATVEYMAADVLTVECGQSSRPSR